MDKVNKKAFDNMIAVADAESTAVESYFKEPGVSENGQTTEPIPYSGFVHTVLGTAGMVPGFGIVPDLIDAGIYALEKDKLGVGLSLAAAVPVTGLVAGGGKLGKVVKGSKASKKTGELFLDIATEFSAYDKAMGTLIHEHGLTPERALKILDIHRSMRKGTHAAEETAKFLKDTGQSIDSVWGTGSSTRSLVDEMEALDWLRENPEWIDKIGLRDLEGFKLFEGYLFHGSKFKIGQLIKEI